MKVYVAGSLDDVRTVQFVQGSVVAAGHDLVLDWTRGPDTGLTDYASHPGASRQLAKDDLHAVTDAEAVLLVVSDKAGRGMFVEFGAALLRAEQGSLAHLVVIGAEHESVFFYDPAVRRFSAFDDWFASLA